MSGVLRQLGQRVRTALDSTLFRNRTNVKGTGTEWWMKGSEFRERSPGSQPAVRIPSSEGTDRIYDIKYLGRNHRANEEMNKVIQITREGGVQGDVKEEATAVKMIGSPGNNNDDVLKYDSSGLRSAMSATNEVLISFFSF